MLTLQQLVDGAVELANPDSTCHNGRMWQSVGGRSCPIGWFDCSQTVYVDVKTGAYDYGERGGPGAADCAAHCPHGREIPPPAEDESPPRTIREGAAYGLCE